MTVSKTLPPITLAERVGRVKPSPTLAVSARADELINAGQDVINLSVGEPDFDTPEHIKAAAISAIHAGRTKYTPVDGIKALKQAVVNKLARENQLEYALNQIIVSCGAKHSLANCFQAILNPGDEVLVVAPFWVSYPDMVLLADAKPVIVQTTFEEQFKLTPKRLQAAITPRTRMLILNSPSNPTGLAYSEGELKAIAAVLLQHPEIVVVSDDIYEHNLWHHTPFKNILNAEPALYDRAIIINGVSKAYAMTGWRIGYTAGPANVIAAMKKLQSQSTSNPCSIAQYAAVAALEGDQHCIRDMTKAYKARHDYFVAALQNIAGVECVASDGTFYVFPRITQLFNHKIKDDLAFAEYLLTEAHVAVVPGSAFGAPGHIRMSYATSLQKLETAVSRIEKAIANLT